MDSEFNNRHNHTINIDSTLERIHNFVKHRDDASIIEVDADVKRLLRQLSKIDSFYATYPLFQCLYKIQYELAKVVFKYHIEVTKFLRKFVRDFDNLEPPHVREYLHKQVKNDSYFLE